MLRYDSGPPSVLDHPVPPAGRPHHAIARPALVRVLAVAQHVGPLEREMQGRRQDGRELGLCRVVCGRALQLRHRCRSSAVKPGHDGRVVGSGVCEGGAGEAAASGGRELALGAQLFEHDRIVRRRRQDTDVLVVLGRGAHHGGPADVDQLDRGVRRERVQVRHHQVDGLDAVGLQVVEVLGLGSVGEDAAVDLRVQGLDPPPEHLGRAGDLGHLNVGDARLGELGRRVAARHQLPTQIRQALGQIDQTLFVVDGQQGSHDLISSTRPSLFPTSR